MNLSVADLADALHWQMWNNPSPDVAYSQRGHRPRKIVKAYVPTGRPIGRPAKDMRVLVIMGDSLTGGYFITSKIRNRKFQTYVHLDGNYAIVSAEERTDLKLVGVYRGIVTTDQIYEDILETRRQ